MAHREIEVEEVLSQPEVDMFQRELAKVEVEFRKRHPGAHPHTNQLRLILIETFQPGYEFTITHISGYKFKIHIEEIGDPDNHYSSIVNLG